LEDRENLATVISGRVALARKHSPRRHGDTVGLPGPQAKQEKLTVSPCLRGECSLPGIEMPV